jgi:hypothetical protein
MHQGVLAARAEIARARIVAQLEQLGQRLNVPVSAAGITAVQGHERFERAMKHLEAVSACLEQILAGLPEADPPKRSRSRKDGLSE